MKAFRPRDEIVGWELKVTVDREVVPWKAEAPIVVTLVGIWKAVRAVAPWKADAPMLVRGDTLEKVTEARVELPDTSLNRFAGMDVMAFPRYTDWG